MLEIPVVERYRKDGSDSVEYLQTKVEWKAAAVLHFTIWP